MHHPFSMPSKDSLETFMNGDLSSVKDQLPIVMMLSVMDTKLLVDLLDS